MALRGPFDGVRRGRQSGPSTTCLIMADHNRYSVDGAGRRAGWCWCASHGRTPSSCCWATRVVADHPRPLPAANQIIYDPWHYLPVLMKKPGALRNGAPFKDWGTAAPRLTQVSRQAEANTPTGIEQFVKVLGAVLDHGPGRGRGPPVAESAGGRHPLVGDVNPDSGWAAPAVSPATPTQHHYARRAFA